MCESPRWEFPAFAVALLRSWQSFFASKEIRRRRHRLLSSIMPLEQIHPTHIMEDSGEELLEFLSWPLQRIFAKRVRQLVKKLTNSGENLSSLWTKRCLTFTFGKKKRRNFKTLLWALIYHSQGIANYLLAKTSWILQRPSQYGLKGTKSFMARKRRRNFGHSQQQNNKKICSQLLMCHKNPCRLDSPCLAFFATLASCMTTKCNLPSAKRLERRRSFQTVELYVHLCN